MKLDAIVNLSAYAIALLLVGIGIACKDPAVSLVVVGGIVLGTIFLSRLPRGRKE